MKNKIKNKINFHLDNELVSDGLSLIVEEVLKKEKLRYSTEVKELSDKNLNIIFTTPKKIKKSIWPKNKIFICSDRELIESPQSIKCDLLSYSEIERVINEIFEAEKKAALFSKLKESEKVFEKIKLINIDKNESEILDQAREVESILDLEIELLKSSNFHDWNNSFKSYIKKTSWLSALQLETLDNVFNDESVLDENVLLFKLAFENYFIFLKFKNVSFNESSLKTELLVNAILKSVQNLDQNLIRTDEEIDFWKRIFAKIPYPMAVITPLGDLLIYNELFAKIGILPKECLSYKDQESIEIHQQFYIVKKIDINLNLQNVFYFVFYTSLRDNLSSTENKAGVDDLGIVSSSIAHELNNPLAGILAALSLLALEEDWNEESRLEIEDMKNGAKRCKELIEIFLGFSRFSPNHKYQSTISDALDQAINLLRFRMVESNLRIEMRHMPTLENFSAGINSSILSMIFYLIISELLTSFAHHRLISQKISNAMSGEVVEFNNQIVFRLDEDFEYEDKLAQSKLIQHLLMFEKMEINFLKKEIRLIYRG